MSSENTVERQFGEKLFRKGEVVRMQMESLVPSFPKVTKGYQGRVHSMAT
jgi:hypothetical protein